MEDGGDCHGSVGVKKVVLGVAGVQVFMVKEDQAGFGASGRPRARLRDQPLGQCVSKLGNRLRYLWVDSSRVRARLHAHFGWWCGAW
jgi:hypothetical protein